MVRETFVSLAENVARKAHDGRLRRTGKPYIEHPEAVAKSLDAYSGAIVAAAWLHDVIEDDDSVTSTSLKEAGIPERVVEAVVALTKGYGDSYEDYLRCVKENTIARVVKVADICHNLTDSPTEEQKAKYLKALLFLTE